MGFHDWDSAAAYRYLTVLALRRDGEMPWWHPYLCGGFAGWGYSEGVPNLVSPLAPLYFLVPLPLALRLEIAAMALLGLAGAYLLAGRFTRSVALRCLVAVVFVVNGRWALQTGVGHVWHLRYAWTPFALYFFDAAVAHGWATHVWRRAAVATGVVMALLVYEGGIYPLPHTALVLGVWAAAWAVARRSLSPFVALAVAGFTALGLSAPKLLAVADNMSRFTRRIDSTEATGLLETFRMLADPHQGFAAHPVPIPAYGWHEWGSYVGLPAVVAMGVGVLFGRGPRENLLKALGLFFVVLSLGAVHPQAPWTLLHKLPVFASQHVPSRFLYLGVLFLMLLFVAVVERVLRGCGPLARRLCEIALFAPVVFVAMNLTTVNGALMGSIFTMRIPDLRPGTFRQVASPTYGYVPGEAWAGPSYPAMLANEGFWNCYSVPDKAEPKGALAADAPGYRGEAYVADGPGTARVLHGTVNGADVEYEGVRPGSVVVYNMNWDPSWRADGAPALDQAHAVAARVGGERGVVRFRYRPRTLGVSLVVFAATVLGLVLMPARRRARAFGWIRARLGKAGVPSAAGGPAP